MRKIVIALAVTALALLLVVGTALAATPAQPGEAKVWIGILPANITSKLAQRFGLSQTEGVVVAAVTPKSPAAVAGVKVGDVLTAVNGVAVKTAQDVQTEFAKHKVGDEIALTIVRGGATQTIKATAAAAPARLQRLGKIVERLRQKFDNNYGSTHTHKDANGNVVATSSIPGVVTAISATSITITPNNPESRGGPFTIDGSTRIVTGRGGATTDNIKAGDKVIVVVIADGTHAEAISKPSLVSKLRQFVRPSGGGLMFQRPGADQNGLRRFRQLQQQPRLGIGT